MMIIITVVRIKMKNVLTYAGGHIIVETLWLVLQVMREEVVYHASHQRHLWLKNKL